MGNVVMSKLQYILIIIAVIVFSYLGAIKLFFILMPFLIGLLISKIISPIVVLLHKYLKLPNSLSTVISILTFIGISGLLLYEMSLYLITYLNTFANMLLTWSNNFPAYSVQLSDYLESLKFHIPFDLAGMLSDVLPQILKMAGSIGSRFASESLTMITNLPKLLIALIITMLSAFFFTKDRQQIEDMIQPYKQKYLIDNTYYQQFKTDVINVIFGYIKAQCILMSITSTISALGLWLIGISNPIPIGIGIGLVDALPILGPASVYMPWILIQLITGNTAIALKLFILYLCTTITRQILEPKVVGVQIGIHPLLTLSALYLGVKFLGFIGLIIGPLTAVFIMTTYKRFHHTKGTVATGDTSNLK